jgi:hypothetical protein
VKIGSRDVKPCSLRKLRHVMEIMILCYSVVCGRAKINRLPTVSLRVKTIYSHPQTVSLCLSVTTIRRDKIKTAGATLPVVSGLLRDRPRQIKRLSI